MNIRLVLVLTLRASMMIIMTTMMMRSIMISSRQVLTNDITSNCTKYADDNDKYDDDEYTDKFKTSALCFDKCFCAMFHQLPGIGRAPG